MDYEKKYKEANGKVAARFGINIAKETFTDLYESEDEKIRKELIKETKGSEERLFETVTNDEFVAWLEKQGEVTIDIDKMVRDYANNTECGNEEFGKPINCMIRAYRQGLTDALSTLNLKKQGEQKPTDNDMVEALKLEYEKGRADVLRVIDPDEMVAGFCSQPLSKTRSLASIYRQGIIDIVKRINNNEKTSITGTRSIDDGGVHRA